MFILEFVSTLILGLVTFATVVDRERNMSDNAAPLVARPPPLPRDPRCRGDAARWRGLQIYIKRDRKES